MKILGASDYQAMCRKAANILSAQVILFPDSVLGLATGATPVGVYGQMLEWYRKGDLDFSRIHTVNLDEYCGLPPEHPQSYRYYMNHHLFNHVNIRMGNTHLPDGRPADIQAECRRYDALIAALGGIDMQLLGIGHNGHIGFNEPDEAFGNMTHCVSLNERTRNANARFFGVGEQVPEKAISMGIRSIMHAKKILLVVSGADKSDILCHALLGPVTPTLPASILQLHPDVTVVADEEALTAWRSADKLGCVHLDATTAQEAFGEEGT